MSKSVHFRGSVVQVNDADYAALATVGAEAAARFFSMLDHEAKTGVQELRGASRREAKPASVEAAKMDKAAQLHDVVALMRRSRGQPV